jgi:hypothetical protein
MVVTCEVPYSNSNNSDEFLWTWNAPASINKIFRFALKCYFISKTVRCFWSTPQITRWQPKFPDWVSGELTGYILKQLGIGQCRCVNLLGISVVSVALTERCISVELTLKCVLFLISIL